MTTSLAELVSGDDSDTVLQRLLDLMTLGGFPATAWQTLSMPRQLLEAEGTYQADLSQAMAAIAQGGFIDYAVQREIDGLDVPGASWLELIGEQFFSAPRNPSIVTLGTYTLTDVGGVGPVTINAGALTVSEATKTFQFQNTAAVTVPLNGSATVALTAVTPGAAYNLGNNQIQTFITSYPGLNGSNVPNPISQTWITQQGADVEAPTQYGARLKNKWGSISAGGNIAYYTYYATSGFSEVTRYLIVENFETGVHVIMIAGTNGPVSAATLAAVQAQIAAVRGCCINVSVQNAAAYTGTIVGTIYVKAGYDLDAVLSQVQSAILAYAASTTMGDIVRVSEIVEAALSVPGTYNFVLTQPAADIPLSVLQVWAPQFAIGKSR